MSLTTYAPSASRSGIPPAAWLVVGILAFGVLRAAEGIADIGMEILGVGSGPDTSPESAARLHASRAPRELAGCLVIAASTYAVHFVHRAAAEVADLARDHHRQHSR